MTNHPDPSGQRRRRSRCLVAVSLAVACVAVSSCAPAHEHDTDLQPGSLRDILDPARPGEDAVLAVLDHWEDCFAVLGLEPWDAHGESAQRDGDPGKLITLLGDAVFFVPDHPPRQPLPDNSTALQLIAEATQLEPHCAPVEH